MNRFWERFIGPLMEAASPACILEVGALYGWNTRNVLEYCRRTGSQAMIVDPVPQAQLLEVLAEYPKEHTFFRCNSTEALPKITLPDLVLIDGDHNWWTVFEELSILFARAAKEKGRQPIVLLHDCAWPYARRDMYYNPDELAEAVKQPYAYRGIIPGTSELVDGGMNASLANALHEGGPRNGVLTAVEDFIAASGIAFDFRILPFYNGLGIMVPTSRSTAKLTALIDSFFSAQTLLDTCVALERDGMNMRAEVATLQARLDQRTDALARARRILEDRAKASTNS